ncbi:MAG: sulfite exporter TauE/SafE family protein [Clostridiaceae bacterium]
MDIYIIIFSALIIFFASVVQGATSFGFALVAASLLTFLFPMKIVVPMVVICSFVNNIIVVYSTKHFINIRNVWLMILFGILGIPIGVFGLNTIDPELLKLIVGILILITSISMAKGYKIKFKRKNLSYGLTGFISGVLNGSVSISGPPIVLFLSNEGCDKNEFRANLALYALITNGLTIIVFAIDNLLSTDMVSIFAIIFLPLLLGSFLGLFISNKIPDKYFKKIVLFLLIIISIVTIIKSIL